jgi:c-di-GMP-binding flagellar brake protein YcgR
VQSSRILELLSSTRWIHTAQTERRQWNRHSLCLQVTVVAVSRHGFQIFHGQARDICQGGMSVYLSQVTPLEVGELILLEFSMTHALDLMRIQATIRQRMNFLYRFEFLRPISRERIILGRAWNLRRS